MKLVLAILAVAAWAQAQPELRGTVTDPSGAAVPGASVELRGPGGQRRARSGRAGEYEFTGLAAGRYQLTVQAKGFATLRRKDIEVDRPRVQDVRLAIETRTQVVNVDDALGRVAAEPESNGSAVVMRGRQLAALSDDPDELALELEALAGPAPGPNGGEMFIDGFTGGNLPPKSAIREIRINANPFSPEYGRPGFSRVEIFTKPGSDAWHGQAFAQFNDRVLNTRNSLVEGDRPPYRTQFYGLNLAGPLRRNKASLSFDAERRTIDENAFILATVLDGAGNPQRINQALATPQTRTMVAPRLDYAFTPKYTLVARYQEMRAEYDNQGVGDFNLASRAYNSKETERVVQATATAALSARAINESRFQFQAPGTRAEGGSDAPSIVVVGAFTGGGSSVGTSARSSRNWEGGNLWIYTRGRHTVKWGGRARESRLADTSVANFAGTFTFYSLDQYRQGIPAQFSRNAGTAETRVGQADAGLFVGDDWRARANLTLSFGLRYEVQSNAGGPGQWAPRFGLARSFGRNVLRAGAGAFYDRIPLNYTLNARRYDGVTQQSFLILDPGFYPGVPSAAFLDTGDQPQQLRPLARGIAVARLYQASVGVERQLNRQSKVSLTWVGSRGVHLLDTRNVNTPIGGAYPYGDRSIRLLTESGGLSSQNQVTASANVTARGVMWFGFYTLSYGKDNNEGLPADPYNLRAEWGPSTYGDVRHRMVLGANAPLPAKFSASLFVVANSGVPYNITTGEDPNLTGYPAARPGCCFVVNPAPGTAIGRNFGRGPAASNVALRLSRTWSFGREGRSGPADTGGGDSHAGMPPRAMMTSAPGRRYGITLSASTMNALNHPNYAPPDGNLSSPYFGQYRALGGLMVMAHGGGASTYNRKIDMQLRFSF